MIPTIDGWYWQKDSPESGWQVVRLEDYRGTMVMWVPGSELDCTPKGIFGERIEEPDDE